MEPLLSPPLLFAHRGGMAHGPENTMEAFRTALRLGATGLESDVWITADGVPVLSHGGSTRTGRFGRSRPIAATDRAALPSDVPALADLYADCGTGFALSLDIKDVAAVPAVLAVARAASASDRLWLCHSDHEQVAQWRQLDADVRLVDSTRLRRIKEGAERRASTLADTGVDGINLHATDWSAGLTTLFHRFDRLTLGWDAQFERVILSLLGMGIDGVYSDHVDRMVDALTLHLR